MILPSVFSISTKCASGITQAGQGATNPSTRQRIVFLREPLQQEKNVHHHNTREKKRLKVTCWKSKCLVLKVIMESNLNSFQPSILLGHNEIQIARIKQTVQKKSISKLKLVPATGNSC